MTKITMIGWRENLQVISLAEAIKESSTGSLVRAKLMVENLLAGESVILDFPSEKKGEEFKRKAEALGAIFDCTDSGQGVR